jgi:solute carrier family 7 (cationic amino acid transporter), member 2
MAYSIVAACVLLLKYEVDDPETEEYIQDKRTGTLSKIWNSEQIRIPTKFTSGLATILVSLYALFCVCMSLVISLMGGKILDGDALAITLLSLSIAAIILTMTILVRQPKSSKILTFTVPFTPWFPALSIMINLYLMTGLDVATWIRFGVWIAIGLVIYIFYGRKFSKEKERALLNQSYDTSIDKVY